MKKTNPLVSVIVPVYNIDKYIGECLDSIVGQTYKNLEIILINDKSTDNSLEICKKYQKTDKRIKIINNRKNSGLSFSRNAGMKNMSGEYVMFVDGDDWIDEGCVEYCVKSFKENTDIILFPFKKEYARQVITVDLFDTEKTFTEREVQEFLVRKLFGPYKEEMKNPEKMDNVSSTWGKMYRSKIMKNKKFIDTKKIGIEDGIMNIPCFLDARKIKYINNVFYHYRKTNLNSLTKTYDKNTFKKWKNLYREIEKYANIEPYKEALNNRRVINLLTGTLRVTISNLPLKNKKKEIKKILSDEIIRESFDEFDMSYLTLVWKTYYSICRKNMIRSLIFFNSIIIMYKKLKWGNA